MTYKTLTLLLACLLLSPISIHAAGNTRVESFNKAKKLLERNVYFDHRETIYCGAPFDEKKQIALPEGFSTEKHKKRSRRVEWEHMTPAENFGRAFPEWRDGHPECVKKDGSPFKGRNCARKVNREFRFMEADMYNLVPAIGSVNAARSNKQYSELPGSSPAFGSCAAKIDGNRFEPPAKAKGEVARAGLYMADAYGPRFRISDQQRNLFEAWDRMFPVTDWECTRAKRIEEIQGNENKFVKRPCIEKGLW